MLKNFPFVSLIIVLLFSVGNLYAEEESFFPDFTLSSTEDEPVFTARLPWHMPSDVLYNREKSVFWNQNYRAEIGQFVYYPIEYQKYAYNNRSVSSDDGTIKEWHSYFELRSGIFPNIVMIFGLGYSQLERDVGGDGITHYQKFQGYNVTLGIEAAVSIAKEFLIIFHGDWRTWSGWSGPESTGDEMYGHRWNGDIKFMLELFSEYDGPTLDIFAGIGYHYSMQRWTINNITYNISPNNSNSDLLQNGPEAFDVIAGLWFSPRRWLYIGFEAKFVGPTTGRLIVSFIFN